MHRYQQNPVVYTVKEKCRVCYTCVRECPSKAIRIVEGQAEVIPERCIGCGNCITVCSQSAKQVIDSANDVFKLLESNKKVAAIVAPSFPAQFADIDYKKLVSAIKKLGFKFVHEVSLGADLVANEYKKLLNSGDKSYIATTCPAIVAYVEKYHPSLVDNLAPIVSPMLATARFLKEKHGEDLKIVFIGPCVAKKSESLRYDMYKEVDEVITFTELEKCFLEKHIDPKLEKENDFDKPYGSLGGLFPISRGMLQTAGIKEDLITSDVVSASGRSEFKEALKEFENGYLKTRLLELLSCQGCIMGAGINNDIPMYQRKELVSKYVRNRLATSIDENNKESITNKKDKNKTINNDIENIINLIDFKCYFTVNDQRVPVPVDVKIESILTRMGKHTLEDELNCGACGYETCREHAIAIYKGLAESEMCLPYTIDRLKSSIGDLENSYKELKIVKEVLNQREKLASMGQLAAGISHEVNNPLGIVLMYSHMLLEDTEDKVKLKEDISVIIEQANRCKKIVSGLLNFSRQNKLMKDSTDIIALIRRCVDALNVDKSISISIENNLKDNFIQIDKEQFSQVVLNLVNNSVDALEDAKNKKLFIKLYEKGTMIYIEFNDTGNGIEDKILNKIFDPFFTTKQIGKGTGLGLPVSYGIIKMHRGNIKVFSNTDESKGELGTSVRVSIPKE